MTCVIHWCLQALAWVSPKGSCSKSWDINLWMPLLLPTRQLGKWGWVTDDGGDELGQNRQELWMCVRQVYQDWARCQTLVEKAFRILWKCMKLFVCVREKIKGCLVAAWLKPETGFRAVSRSGRCGRDFSGSSWHSRRTTKVTNTFSTELNRRRER